jgi:predicted helicase/DNA-directed RNA polymerase subunit F
MLSMQEVIKAKNKVQFEACLKVTEKLREHGKAVLNKATGSGKTRTAYKQIFHNFMPEVRNVLFMVPKQSLVQQTIDEWTEVAQSEGKTFNHATKYANGDCKEVEEIQEFFQQPGINVLFAVYNSVGVQADGTMSTITESGVQFDLAVYDECHRVAGKEAGLFTSCVTDEIVNAKYKLFMTATMKSYDIDEEEGEVMPEFDMRNEEMFGPVAYSLSVAEAIRLGLLVPFDTYFLEVSDLRLKTMLKSEVRFLGELVSGRQLAAAYGVLKAYNSGSRKVLVMYHRRQDAHDFNNLFRFLQRQYNFLPGAVINCVSTDVSPAQLGAPRHISANNSLAARQWWLKEGPFSTSETAVATSSPWIKEGEDIPCIDTIVFGDRFNSGIDIIQIIGRALRWFDGKERAKIILPVLEGEANKAARSIQATVQNLQENTEEVQIVRNEYKAPSNNDISSTEGALEDDRQRDQGGESERHDRWVFDTAETQVTTLDINQGEYTLNVVHDETFTEEARVEHEQMLQMVSLKLRGDYRQYLTGQRAKRFVKEIVYNVEEGFDMKHYVRSKRELKSNDFYVKQYAEKYRLTKDEAQQELSEYISEIDELRDHLIAETFGI